MIDNLMKKKFYQKREDFLEYSRNHLANEVLPEGVVYDYDVPYGKDGIREHHMDIFRPKDRDGALLPIILNIHGGGMIMSHKEFNRNFNARLCLQGYVVFSIEYRLVPEVLVYEQFADIFLAMDSVLECAQKYQADTEHVYAVGESAGAYFGVYLAAMQKEPRIALAAGVVPSKLEIKALGLISGTFYTNKFDEIGLFMPRYLYGKNYKKSAFAPYVNVENPILIQALPPCFMVTSHMDNFRHYTFQFEDVLARHGIVYELLEFTDKEVRLPHAFSVFNPTLQESLDLMQDMAEFFKQY